MMRAVCCMGGLWLIGVLGMIGVGAEQQPPAFEGHPERFGLGEPASMDLIQRLDIDVRPDGTGLPEGSGTAAAGAPVYAARCASCHGPSGEGATANQLVGAAPVGASPATIGNYWPYATTLFDYIRRAMPTNAPGSLSTAEVYGLTAWLLSTNGIIDTDADINARTLPLVRMPARDMFVPDDRLDANTVR